MPKRRRAPRAESWKEALERARLGVWDWNLTTGDCFYSASWTRMLGYEDGELTMSSDLWMKLVHPDITRQKLVEHQLEQVNARFELALAASGTGIWHHDLDTHKSFWDERTRAIFGVDQAGEDLPQDLWHTFLHPDDRDRAERAHSGSEAWQDDMSIRYRIVRRDGEVRYIETFARHVPGPGPIGRL